MNTPLKTAPGNRIRKVAWVPLINGCVPFARSRKEPELFYCVGGKIDPGETPEQALIREVLEEARVRLIPGTIAHLRTFEGPCHGYTPETVLEMLCFDARHEGIIEPGAEVAQIAPFTLKDKYRTTQMGADILDWRLAA